MGGSTTGNAIRAGKIPFGCVTVRGGIWQCEFEIGWFTYEITYKLFIILSS